MPAAARFGGVAISEGDTGGIGLNLLEKEKGHPDVQCVFHVYSQRALRSGANGVLPSKERRHRRTKFGAIDWPLMNLFQQGIIEYTHLAQ